MNTTPSSASYEQNAAYLNPLLRKHRAKEGITYEDLQNAWKTLEKLCHASNSKPQEEMNALHQSLLEKYSAAAKEYYESYLSNYRPPSPSPSPSTPTPKPTPTATLESQSKSSSQPPPTSPPVSAAEYIRKETQSVLATMPRQEWRITPSQKKEWFDAPLKNILLQTHKKYELKRKLEGLKKNKENKNQQGPNESSGPKQPTSISTLKPNSKTLVGSASASGSKMNVGSKSSKEHELAKAPATASISEVRKQVEEETMKEETHALTEEMKKDASASASATVTVLASSSASPSNDGEKNGNGSSGIDGTSQEEETEGDGDVEVQDQDQTESEDDEESEIDLTISDGNDDDDDDDNGDDDDENNDDEKGNDVEKDKDGTKKVASLGAKKTPIRKRAASATSSVSAPSGGSVPKRTRLGTTRVGTPSKPSNANANTNANAKNQNQNQASSQKRKKINANTRPKRTKVTGRGGRGRGGRARGGNNRR